MFETFLLFATLCSTSPVVNSRTSGTTSFEAYAEAEARKHQCIKALFQCAEDKLKTGPADIKLRALDCAFLKIGR